MRAVLIVCILAAAVFVAARPSTDEPFLSEDMDDLDDFEDFDLDSFEAEDLEEKDEKGQAAAPHKAVHTHRFKKKSTGSGKLPCGPKMEMGGLCVAGGRRVYVEDPNEPVEFHGRGVRSTGYINEEKYKKKKGKKATKKATKKQAKKENKKPAVTKKTAPKAATTKTKTAAPAAATKKF